MDSFASDINMIVSCNERGSSLAARIEEVTIKRLCNISIDVAWCELLQIIVHRPKSLGNPSSLLQSITRPIARSEH